MCSETDVAWFLRRPQSTGLLVGIGLLLFAAGCDSAPSEYDHYSENAVADDEPNSQVINREDALEDAAAAQSGMTYSDLGEPYGCTEDCSGHEAGVAWAEENDLRDPDDCGGRSQSFVEGCQAYAEAIQESADQIEERGY